jgi:hypothetical protein
VKKAVKQKVGRKCSICAHKDVGQINTLLSNAVSFRVISRQFTGDDKARDSLRRHTENCLKLEIGSIIKERKLENAINVHEEFREQLAFAKKLRAAAEEYLSSETDPMRLVLIPRADEIDVTYYDFADTTPKGEPKKKTATLHALMAKVENLNLEADKITIKHVDMRKFALDAINTADTCIDKFAKLGGDYSKDKENPITVDQIADTIASRLIDNGWTEAEARQFAAGKYPEVSQAVN